MRLLDRLSRSTRNLRIAARSRWTLLSSPRHRQFPGEDPDVLDCRIAYNIHGGFCVPLSSHHRNLARTILDGEVWEPETLDLLASVDPDLDLVHAGTFFGDFLPALSRSRSEEALVWGFEPNPENHRAAKITCWINGLSNVRLSDAALGPRPGMARLRSHDREGWALGGASEIVPDADPGRAVPLVSLDAAIPNDRTIGAVHLDVEGYEQPALEGALGLLERCTPLLVLETLPDEAWIEENLEPLGYRTRGRCGRNRVMAVH